MKKCLSCKNEFQKSKVVGGHLSLAWIIFIFFSMGIGLIFWLFFRKNKKEVCPYCKSENIIDKEFYKKESINSEVKEKILEVPSLKFMEKKLINEYIAKHNIFDKDNKDLIFKHYSGKINILKPDNLITLEEKREYGINPKLKISRDLLNIFDLELIDNQNPKNLFENLLIDVRNKFRLFEKIQELKYTKGIDEVQLSCANDERTCTWCKDNDNKKISLREDVVSIICDNCTCDSFRSAVIPIIK